MLSRPQSFFLISAFPTAGFAAGIKAAPDKIFDFANAVDGRLSLNGTWNVSNFPEDLNKVDTQPYAPVDMSEFPAITGERTWQDITVPNDLSQRDSAF